jgi:hypothetical protein
VEKKSGPLIKVNEKGFSQKKNEKGKIKIRLIRACAC